MSEPALPVYVVDTHAIYWYIVESSRLSQTARQILRDGEAGRDALIVPHIAAAELFWVFRKYHQQHLFAPTLARLEGFCHVHPNTPEDLRELPTFSVDLEMHDLLIVLLARRLRAPVVTCDGKISGAQVVRCVW